jgi:DNA-binding transcriptional ArsR family regulator
MKNTKKPKFTTVSMDTYPVIGRRAVQYVRFNGNSCRYFFNAQHLYLGLTDKERCFFDFCCEHMLEENNNVLLDNHFKQSFIDFVSDITSNKVQVSMDSVTHAVSKLKDRHLIVDVFDTRGYYMVNPKYVYKGSEKNRKELLTQVLERCRITGKPYNMFLDRTKEELLGTKTITAK